MNKKIGIGIVGAGWIGSTFMKRIQEHPHAQVAGLHQRNRERAIGVLNELQLPQDLYASTYESLLELDGVDAVFICSPNHAHGPQAIAALEAGKHVFCEKPCATTYQDYLKQIELEQANPGLINLVDYLMNFDDMENRLLGMTRGGVFGQITQIQINYRHPINISGNKAWKLSAEQMGDAIGMGIIHSLSVMLNIMAEQAAHPVEVYATNSSVHTRPFECPAIWNLQIKFSNGACGFCFGNVDQANGYDAYHNLHGTEGGFIFDSYADQKQKVRFWSQKTTNGEWVYPLDATRCTSAGHDKCAWPENFSTPDSGDVVQHQTGSVVNHFIDSIIEKKQSFLSFANSSSVAELGWAAQISAAKGIPIKLPLDPKVAKAFFAGDQG